MGLREIMNRHKGASGAAGVVILLSSLAFTWQSQWNAVPSSASRAYYSDDDGKTTFPDDINKLYPFDHNGKQAHYAGVYQCGAGGKPFVVFLQRWTDKGRAEVAPLLPKAGDPRIDQQIAEIRGRSIEVKKPGDSAWVSENSSAGGKVMTPTCPDGGTDVRVVFP